MFEAEVAVAMRIAHATMITEFLSPVRVSSWSDRLRRDR